MKQWKAIITCFLEGTQYTEMGQQENCPWDNCPRIIAPWTIAHTKRKLRNTTFGVFLLIKLTMVLFSCFIICYPIRRFIFLYHYNCTTKIVLSIVREQLPYKGNCPGGGSCPISLEKDSNVIMKPDFNGIATFLFANIWLFLSFLSFNPRRLTNTLTHMHCNTLPLSTPLFLILSSLAVVLFLFASLT